MQHISRIPPFSEVPDVLRKLQANFKIGLISNTDDDIIAGSLETLGVVPDYIVTAQQAGAYKPNLRLFQYAHVKMGIAATEVLHAAASQELDLQVCETMGIRSIWVNRRGETLDDRWHPSAVITDLTDLPSIMHVS